MYKFFFILFFSSLLTPGFAQEVDSTKAVQQSIDVLQKVAQDSVKETRKERKAREKAEKERAKYYYKDIKKDSARLHIEALSRKAWRRSLVLPGWGQYTNGGLWWLKVPVIYGGFVGGYLTFDYWQFYYKTYLEEIQYRVERNDVPNPNGPFADYANTQGLITRKDNFRRNRDLVVLATLGWYGLNVLEAYVNSMLKNRWDISSDLSFKVSPTFIPTSGYGANSFQPNLMTPGIKLTMSIH